MENALRFIRRMTSSTCGCSIWRAAARRASLSRRISSAIRFGRRTGARSRTVRVWLTTRNVGIYRKASNGATDPELLLKTGEVICPEDWSRDGKYLLYGVIGSSHIDLWVRPIAGKPNDKGAPFLSGHFQYADAQFSPDGRWIAYDSNESGKNEVYVRPFTPGGTSMAGDGKWMISSAGGEQPRWSRDGKKIVYWQDTGKLMSVPVEASGSALKPGVATPLFDLPIGVGTGGLTSLWDMTPDGAQFLANTYAAAAADAPITVVLNWLSGVKH